MGPSEDTATILVSTQELASTGQKRRLKAYLDTLRDSTAAFTKILLWNSSLAPHWPKEQETGDNPYGAQWDDMVAACATERSSRKTFRRLRKRNGAHRRPVICEFASQNVFGPTRAQSDMAVQWAHSAPASKRHQWSYPPKLLDAPSTRLRTSGGLGKPRG